MKTFEERLDALVARVQQEEANSKIREKEAIETVMDICLKALENSDNILNAGVVVSIPTNLIRDVPAWNTSDEMASSLSKLFQDKIMVIGNDSNPHYLDPIKSDNAKWIFRLIVKSTP